MQNFTEIAGNLKDMSNEDVFFTVDSFNTEKGISHLSYYDRMKSCYNGYSLNDASFLSFMALYKEKLNYKNYKDDDFFEDYCLNSDSFITDIKLKNLLNKDLNNLSRKIESEEYIEKLKNSGNISNKRLSGLIEKNSLIEKKIDLIKKEIEVIDKRNENFIVKLEKMKDIYNEIDETQERKLNSAELFVKSKSSGNKILEFINGKIDQGTKWEFTKSQKYEEVIFFEDKSIATLKDGIFETIKPVVDNYNKLSRDIVDCFIEYTFRKNQSYINGIKEMLKRDKYKLTHFKSMADTFLNNSQLLKNYNFNFKEEIVKSILENNKLIERIDDNMNEIIKNHKISQMYKSIFSNKYNHLINNDTKEIFKNIYNLKIDTKDIQKYVGTKLASFKDSEELNKNLNLFLNKYNSFDVESIKTKALNLNSKLVLEGDNTIILEVSDYNACKELGSSSWCITRQESYFDSYSSGGNKQYIYFDFNKPVSDELSMIGFTIRKDGVLETAHIRNDNFIDFDKKYKNEYYSTIQNEISNFNLSKELEELISVENKKYQIKNKI